MQHYGHSQVDILNPELSIFPDYLLWVYELELELSLPRLPSS